jgi:ribosomal protein S14
MTCCRLATLDSITGDHVSMRCPIHGTSYLFIHDGKIESAQDRQERLKDELVCDDCGKEYRVVRASKTGNVFKLCRQCTDKRRTESILKARAIAKSKYKPATPKTQEERIYTAWL